MVAERLSCSDLGVVLVVGDYRRRGRLHGKKVGFRWCFDLSWS